MIVYQAGYPAGYQLEASRTCARARCQVLEGTPLLDTAPSVKIFAMFGGESRGDDIFLETAKLSGVQRALDKPLELQHLLITVREGLHPETSRF